MSDIKVLPLVDQVTLVLQPTENKPISNWSEYAQSLIETFMKKSKLAEVFGFEEKGRLFEGYNTGMTTFNAPFYCCIAYHDTVKNMGIVVHFSGWSFHRFQEKTGWKLHDFIQNSEDESYSIRLSRLDNAIDILNAEIDVDELYKSIVDNKTIVQFSNGRKNPSILKPYIERDLDIASFYIGSLKRSNSVLRVYDKKSEMIQTNGHLKDFYQRFESAIRFEQKLKGNLAHQASHKIRTINSNIELEKFILSSVTNKYRFVDYQTNKYRHETSLVLDSLEEVNFSFEPMESRANSLEATRDYLINNSGLLTYFHKINAIYGSETVKEGVEDLYAQFRDSTPNESVGKWLSKYQNIYEEQTFKPWETVNGQYKGEKS